MEKDISNTKTTGSDTNGEVMYLVYYYNPTTLIRNIEPVVVTKTKQGAENCIKHREKRLSGLVKFGYKEISVVNE